MRPDPQLLTIPRASYVIAYGPRVAIPSAKVWGGPLGTGLPDLQDWYVVAAPAACTPYTRVVGRNDRKTAIAPTATEPPPIATIIASSPVVCSNSSSASVPAPASTSRLLVAWTSVNDRSRAKRSARVAASS